MCLLSFAYKFCYSCLYEGKSCVQLGKMITGLRKRKKLFSPISLLRNGSEYAIFNIFSEL